MCVLLLSVIFLIFAKKTTAMQLQLLKWVRKEPPVCPHCQKKIVFSNCAKYFFYGIMHLEKCSHCHKSIKPVKEPVPFALCYCLGVFVAITSFYFFVYFVEDHLGKAILFSIVCGVILFVVLCLLVYKYIRFTRA